MHTVGRSPRGSAFRVRVLGVLLRWLLVLQGDAQSIEKIVETDDVGGLGVVFPAVTIDDQQQRLMPGVPPSVGDRRQFIDFFQRLRVLWKIEEVAALVEL